MGHDAGLQVALFVLSGAGQADKAFAVFGPLGAQDKVPHAAVAGYLMEARAFGVHLGVEIHFQGVTDAHEVIVPGNHPRVVGIGDRV